MVDTAETIDPYNLLGLDHVTCGIADVKKAYKELAILCHPDKGGRPDDMRVLQAAYEWIMQQQKEVCDRTTETYEEKERSYTDFIKTHMNDKIVPLSQVLMDVDGYTTDMFDEIYEEYRTDDCVLKKRFAKEWVESCIHNNYIMSFYGKKGTREVDIRAALHKEISNYISKHKSNKMLHAAVPHGYGYLMDSTPPLDGNVMEPIKHSFGKNEIIMYQEPDASVDNKVSTYHDATEVLSTLEDYTTGSMADYCMAYKDTNKPYEEMEKIYPNDPRPISDESALDSLIAQRSEIGSYVGPSKDIQLLFQNFQKQIRLGRQ